MLSHLSYSPTNPFCQWSPPVLPSTMQQTLSFNTSVAPYCSICHTIQKEQSLKFIMFLFPSLVGEDLPITNLRFSNWVTDPNFCISQRKPSIHKRQEHERLRATQPIFGGARGIRTLDPRLAKPMLSHLSYSPKNLWCQLPDSNGGRLVLQTSALT